MDLLFSPAALSGVFAVNSTVDNNGFKFKSLGFVYGGDDEPLLERVAAEVGFFGGIKVGGVAFQLLSEGGVEVGTDEVGLQVV